MEFNKRDMKSILKAGAKARGILLSEFRADLQATVDEAIESPDHEVQKNFKEYSGNKRRHQKNKF